MNFLVEVGYLLLALVGFSLALCVVLGAVWAWDVYQPIEALRAWITRRRSARQMGWRTGWQAVRR